MKIFFFVASFFLLVITGSFATTTTLTFGYRSSLRPATNVADSSEEHLGFYEAMTHNEENINDKNYGLYLRFVLAPQDFGFYFGLEGSIFFFYSGHSLGRSMKIPLGFRAKGRNNDMGFYMGLGPVYRVVSDFHNPFYGIFYPYSSFGGFAEIGLQTNKTKRTGLHVSLQVEVYPFHRFDKKQFTSWDEALMRGSFQVGMSWRRKKESRKSIKTEVAMDSTE